MNHPLRSALALGAAAALVAGCRASGSSAARAPSPEHERVNVGYGSVDRRDVTGSISSLSAEDLTSYRVSRMEELLRDRLPGVSVSRLPNGEITIHIRGTRSLIGSNEPLVVIDGMPVSGRAGLALSLLNPNDVTRIDVLKDAGSTAAYGSRGANGVILISTRAAR